MKSERMHVGMHECSVGSKAGYASFLKCHSTGRCWKLECGPAVNLFYRNRGVKMGQQNATKVTTQIQKSRNETKSMSEGSSSPSTHGKSGHGCRGTIIANEETDYLCCGFCSVLTPLGSFCFIY